MFSVFEYFFNAAGGPDTSHYGQSIKRRKLLKLSHPEVVPVEQYPWFLAHDVSDAFYQGTAFGYKSTCVVAFA